MRAVNITDERRLAESIATDGLTSYNDAVSALVMRARAQGYDLTSLDILGDPGQPEVARQRAFGNVAAALANSRQRRSARKAA